MMSLTQKQHDLFVFLKDAIEKTGVAPSFAEMAVHVGLSPKSKGAIFRHLTALEERGRIRRKSYSVRAIEIIGPETNCPHCSRPLGSPECFAAARASKITYSRTPPAQSTGAI